MQNLPVFVEHSACSRCPLAEGCFNPGLPTRPSDVLFESRQRGAPPRTDLAILVVGEAPGFHEDQAGETWVGQAGSFLNDCYIKTIGLHEFADVYLANAVRCRPVGNTTPSSGEIHACSVHLFEDLRTLQAHYQHVLILCVGAPAAYAILNCSLKESFSRQGFTQEWGWAGTQGLRPCVVFSTYHPINLASGYDPARIDAIYDHLALLVSYLEHGKLPVFEGVPRYEVHPPVPKYRVRMASLDTETYGKIEGLPLQTFFHPARSRQDLPSGQLVYSVGMAWKDPVEQYHIGIFDMTRKSAPALLHRHLRHLSEGKGWLLGQNIKFDLLYLRHEYPTLRATLNPDLRVIEMMVLNYMDSEIRPERSLKAVAPLLGVASYEEETAGGFQRYPASSPSLFSYQAKDAFATHESCLVLAQRIQEKYVKSPKTSIYTMEWYSNLVWHCLAMEETGVAFDRAALENLDFDSVLALNLERIRAQTRYGLILSGKGSDASKRALFARAVEAADLVGDSRLEITKTEQLSINQKNSALIMEYLDPEHPLAEPLRVHRRYERLQKLVTSYTRPLLHGSLKKTGKQNPEASRLTLVTTPKWEAHIAYPSWFPVPSTQESGDEGGTKQVRITVKNPAVQTQPPAIKKCMTSRYRPGFLLTSDLSQIELRAAALLSGDPLMIQEYQEGIDRHTRTGKLIIEVLLSCYQHRSQFDLGRFQYDRRQLLEYLDLPSLKSPNEDVSTEGPGLFRQMGKTSNFLALFRGGGFKLRATVADDIGAILPLTAADGLIYAMRGRYPRFNEYQEELIETACTKGYLELPVLGQTRSFFGTSEVVRETYTPEICNFPIQAVAAAITLDIEMSLSRVLRSSHHPITIVCNRYDAMDLDGPLASLPFARSAVDAVFRRSDYYDRLQNTLARKVPLDYDVHIREVA